MRKRLVVALIAILCVIGVTGFSPKAVMASADTSNATIEGNVDDQESLQNYIESYWYSWNEQDISEIAQSNYYNAQAQKILNETGGNTYE